MKIQRLIAILTVLLRTDCLPASALAEKFQVSVRTIYRDIETLEQAGIPIVTIPGVHGGVGIVEEYKIDKKLFTSRDISTLLTSLSTVSGAMDLGALNQTAEKIRALIPPEQVQAIEVDARKLHIDLKPWGFNPHIGENLEHIQRALQGNRHMTFGYTTLKGESTLRRVEPHQLVLKENQWYLRAYCLDREDFRVFKLRRMEGIQVEDSSFAPRQFSQQMRDFRDWTHERMMEIQLLIHPDLVETMLDRCAEENMTPWEDGRVHVRMPFVESDLGYGYLMQQGHRCECIGPPHVREELRRRIKATMAVYEGDEELILE